jgi:catechol-2,3-dioxygenase
MLAEHPIDVMLLATDLGVARQFYADKIGLEVLIETDDFLTLKCGGDSRLVSELRSRGVEVEEYDEPGMSTVDGIADVGFALSAWLVDPHGNTIGLLQFKPEDAD